MVQNKIKNSSTLVNLNVGGSLKQVSRELLTKYKNSLLEKTFSGSFDLKTIDEHVFLERDSKVFDMMLNYLRYDRNYVPKNVDDETKRLFEMEIQHWGVQSEQYIKDRLPKVLVDLLASEPDFDPKSKK